MGQGRRQLRLAVAFRSEQRRRVRGAGELRQVGVCLGERARPLPPAARVCLGQRAVRLQVAVVVCSALQRARLRVVVGCLVQQAVGQLRVAVVGCSVQGRRRQRPAGASHSVGARLRPAAVVVAFPSGRRRRAPGALRLGGSDARCVGMHLWVLRWACITHGGRGYVRRCSSSCHGGFAQPWLRKHCRSCCDLLQRGCDGEMDREHVGAAELTPRCAGRQETQRASCANGAGDAARRKGRNTKRSPECD